MGGSNTKLDQVHQVTQKKKIVIIGGSFGGRVLTQALQALDPQEHCFEITIVDKNPHFEFICSNFKSFVDDDFSKNAIAFESMVKYYNSERVKFVQGKLTNVNHASNEVELEHNGKSFKLPYDIISIVTGGQQTGPWRADYDAAVTIEGRQNEWNEWRAKV